MSENLAIWNALERTDPKHVKEITGKAYRGNSPRPQYVIWRLTEEFGPIGVGFGWTVVHEAYVDGIPHQDGTEKLHECRIRFWAGKGEGKVYPVDSYGCTKALYKAKMKPDGTGGYWVSDEDAAKKSLTDAIVKAASWLGVAGDIFMGRWDDSKYQAELREEFSKPPPRAELSGLSPTAGSSIPGVTVDPETGEVLNVAAPADGFVRYSSGEGLRDAWEDGIRDRLPEDHTELQFYAAAVAQLSELFTNYKSMKGLGDAMNTYGGFLRRLQKEAPKMHEHLLRHYEDCARLLAGAPKKPVLSKAAGEAILLAIGERDTIIELDTYMDALRRGPNSYAADHPKIIEAYEEHKAALIEANPALLGDVRVE